MKKVMPFIVMIGILITIAFVIKAYMNYKLKKYILENKELDDRVMNMMQLFSGVQTDALKWGIILFFAGIGLVTLEFIPYNAEDSPLPYGLEMIFLAGGFLCYYILLRREKK
jgi:uncharacterized oligopeptide transporter (OPT) family protein